jgi:hypothetical protein
VLRLDTPSSRRNTRQRTSGTGRAFIIERKKPLDVGDFERFEDEIDLLVGHQIDGCRECALKLAAGVEIRGGVQSRHHIIDRIFTYFK